MAPPAAPPSVPSPELPPSPMGGEEEMGMEDMEMDDMAPETDVEDVDINVDTEEGGEDQVTFKSIQKLTGKLTQKIRTLDTQEGMTSEDIKYVINMVLSSLDLKSLSEEDMEDIMSKFEEDETEDFGQEDDMDGEDMTDDTEVEDIQADMDVPVEGEMDEDMYGSFGNMKRKDFKGDNYYDENDRAAKDFDIMGIGGDDFDTEEFDTFQQLYDKYGDKQSFFNKRDGEKMFNTYREKTGKPFKVKTRKSEMEDSGNGAIFDSIFGESKVDKVISKYFEVSKKEIREGKEKQIQETAKKKAVVNQIMESVVKMTETIEQELSAKKFLQENLNSKFVGITNKKNLVFETKTGQVRITPNGDLI
jgi:hypothetical protein